MEEHNPNRTVEKDHLFVRLKGQQCPRQARLWLTRTGQSSRLQGSNSAAQQFIEVNQRGILICPHEIGGENCRHCQVTKDQHLYPHPLSRREQILNM